MGAAIGAAAGKTCDGAGVGVGAEAGEGAGTGAKAGVCVTRGGTAVAAPAGGGCE